MERELRILRDSGENYEGCVLMGDQIIDTEPEMELRLEISKGYRAMSDEVRIEVRRTIKEAMEKIVPMIARDA
jgi:hypothetical protein